MHWDSTQLTCDGLTDPFSFWLRPIGSPQEDQTNLDDGPATDRYLTVLWVELGGAWPGLGTTPLAMFSAVFTTAPAFDASTHVRFTAGTTHLGYTLDATPAEISHTTSLPGDADRNGMVNDDDLSLLPAN